MQTRPGQSRRSTRVSLFAPTRAHASLAPARGTADTLRSRGGGRRAGARMCRARIVRRRSIPHLLHFCFLDAVFYCE